MNFFEAQSRARRFSSMLAVLFVLAVAGIILLTNFFLIFVFYYFDEGTMVTDSAGFLSRLNAQQFLISSAVVVGIVGLGSLYKMYELSGGGEVVANALRGRLVPRDTTDARERMLLDVVEEMAIASGVAPPPVYVLKQTGINAFAAGLSYDDAVIGVTLGALQRLEREELQGVIAHEFSHIFNGDMRLNLRIAGWLHGILLIGLIGREILDAVNGYGGDRTRKKGDTMGAVVMIGAGFSVIGFVGTMIGELIKARISHQREFLADASAVQYTRYPQGIANALKKIGGLSEGSAIRAGAAGTYSHLYFADGVAAFWDHLFSTHPPLSKRIRRIEPRWDGTFIEAEAIRAVPEPSRAEKNTKHFAQTAMTSAAVLDAMDRIGTPGEAEHASAKTLLEALPAPLEEMTRQPLTAQGVILALFCPKEAPFCTTVMADLNEESPILSQYVRQAHEQIQTLPRELHLILTRLCLPSLKAMSQAQYLRFKRIAETFIHADGRVSLFEWSLRQIVFAPLDPYFGETSLPAQTHAHLGAVKRETELLISLLAQTQFRDESQARQAFDAAKQTVGANALVYAERLRINLESLDDALERLNEAKPPIRKRVLEMAVACVQVDERLTPGDLEMLEALSAALRLPLPPL